MKKRVQRIALVMMAILLAGCEILPTPGGPAGPATTQPAEQAIRAYFTAPGDRKVRDTLESAVLESIDGAQTQIDVAMYNFSLTSAADALVAAEKRGVEVRVVLDSDALDGRAVQRLRAGGVQVLGDRRESLMHNKFLVIDGRVVWSGSLNLTESGLSDDNNNFVRIESAGLAKAYADEFDEMFNLDVFGGGAPTAAGAGDVMVDGTKVEVLFAPDDRPSRRLEELVRQAQGGIDILAYNFTLNGLRAALVEAQQRGVRVRAVFDESQADSAGGEYATLEKAGAEVRVDGIDGLMHDKVIILDGQAVGLGSYNFNRWADENNDENLLIIHDAGIARAYLAEFERIFAQGK